MMHLTNRALVPSGAWTCARNVVFRNKQLQNEPGFDVVREEDVPLLGVIETPTEYIEFRGNGLTISKIIRVGSNGTATVILNDGSLNFLHPIEGVFRYKFNGDLEIAWWDGIETDSNKPRILNLDTPGFDINPDGTFTLPDSIDLLNLYLEYTPPFMDLINVNESGGNFDTGAYSIFTFYETADGSRTGYTILGNVIYIYEERLQSTYVAPWTYAFEGSDTGKATNKSMTLSFDTLDSKYKKLGIGYIKRSNNTTEAYIEQIIDITTSTQTVILTGSNITTITLEEVLTPKAVYNRAKTGTVSNNRLYLANLQTQQDYELQSIVNDIVVKWSSIEDYAISITSDGAGQNYKDPVVSFNVKTWMPDEVYALYACIHFTNGDKRVFHIPGRTARQAVTFVNTSDHGHTSGDPASSFTADETDLISDIITANPGVNLYNLEQAAGIDTDVKYYEMFDTSEDDGTMGFWENHDEYYATDFPDFGGERVRHHKMPSLEALKRHYVSNKLFYDAATAGLTHITGVAVNPIALQFSNINIPVDMQSVIARIEFLYAARNSSNSLHIGMSYIASTNIDRDTDEVVKFTNINNAARLLPFTALKDRPVINLSYLKTHYKSVFVRHTLTDGDVFHMLSVDADNTEYAQLREITAFGYLNANTDQTGTIGTTGNDDNTDREACVLVEFDGDLENISDEPTLASLFQRNKNCYFGYYGQTLVSTGSMFGSNNSLVTTFGGDVFIVPLAMKHRTYETVTPPYVDRYYWVFPLGVVWEVANVWMRQEGTNDWDKFVPNSDATDFVFVIPDELPYILDNYIEYNNDYSKVQNVVPYIAYFDDGRPSTLPTTFSLPYRVARSITQQSESLEMSWRTFLYNDYYEMDADKGQINVIRALNKYLIIHQEHTLKVAAARDTITTDGLTAALGKGDFFDTEPDEIIPTKIGHIGTNSQWAAIVCPHGYVAVDEKRGMIIIFNGSIQILSTPEVEEFFKTNCSVDGDSPFTGEGWVTVYDYAHDRLIFTRRTAGSDYTISYTFGLGWTAFHNYTPGYMFQNKNGIYFYDSMSHHIYKQQTNLFGTFFDGETYPSFVDFATINTNESVKIRHIEFAVRLLTSAGITPRNTCISHIMLLTDFQCSGLVDIKTGVSLITDLYNVRQVGNVWVFNGTKDAVVDETLQTVDVFGDVDDSNIDTQQHWNTRSEWVTNHLIVRLQDDNFRNYKVAFIFVKVVPFANNRIPQ